MIEPSWAWLKRVVTCKGAPKSKEEAKRAWTQAWGELEQDRIQAWIARIPHHIQEVIRCEGDNCYKEGRPDSRTLHNEARRLMRADVKAARVARLAQEEQDRLAGWEDV